MGDLLLVSFTATWAKPVYVGDNKSVTTAIEGPAVAIRWMENHFKSKRGAAYWRAQSLCYSAVMQQVHPDFARQAFFDAWIEEGQVQPI